MKPYTKSVLEDGVNITLDQLLGIYANEKSREFTLLNPMALNCLSLMKVFILMPNPS